MTTASSRQDLEDQFTAEFQALLNRAVEHFSGSLGELAVPRSVDDLRLRFRTIQEVAEWPEAGESLKLALRSPTLCRLAWDAGRRPIHDPKFWVEYTLLSTMQRYYALDTGSPSASAIRGHTRRIARVMDELIAWAKLDQVPVLIVTPLHGIRPESNRPFKVTNDTVLRVSTQEEWEPILRAQPFAFQPHCLETRRELPRLQSPTLEVPHLFMQALQLALDHGVAVGTTTVRAAVPTFGFSNVSGQILEPSQPVPSGLYRTVKSVATKDLRRARMLAVRLQDLHETGFDLALDLWTSSLHRSNQRERAVDIAIALENLYLGKEGYELTYRFQLHVIAFGRRLKPADRIDIRTAKNLYGARSSVVHGSRPRIRDIKLLNSVGAGLVRATLLGIISQRNRRFLQNIQDETERLVAH